MSTGGDISYQDLFSYSFITDHSQAQVSLETC